MPALRQSSGQVSGSRIRQTFRKSERLSSRKLIQELATTGKRLNKSPLRLVWLQKLLPEKVLCQVAFSVPKKNFKKATDRNLIKRRLKEAYRKNKTILVPLENAGEFQYALLLIYHGKNIITYQETELLIINILKNLVEEIKKNTR